MKIWIISIPSQTLYLPRLSLSLSSNSDQRLFHAQTKPSQIYYIIIILSLTSHNSLVLIFQIRIHRFRIKPQTLFPSLSLSRFRF